jgi:hypothetical protein
MHPIMPFPPATNGAKKKAKRKRAGGQQKSSRGNKKARSGPARDVHGTPPPAEAGDDEAVAEAGAGEDPEPEAEAEEPEPEEPEEAEEGDSGADDDDDSGSDSSDSSEGEIAYAPPRRRTAMKAPRDAAAAARIHMQARFGERLRAMMAKFKYKMATDTRRKIEQGAREKIADLDKEDLMRIFRFYSRTGFLDWINAVFFGNVFPNFTQACSVYTCTNLAAAVSDPEIEIDLKDISTERFLFLLMCMEKHHAIADVEPAQISLTSPEVAERMCKRFDPDGILLRCISVNPDTMRVFEIRRPRKQAVDIDQLFE